MADVSRGQLVVVTALLLAVLFVGLALVLNSGIYAENLGSRETASEPKEVQQQRSFMDEDLRELTDRTNAESNTTDASKLQTMLEHAFENHSRVRVAGGARQGESIEIQLLSAHNGTRLRQTNESRNFTAKDGAVHWNLTTDVPDGGQFAMNIQEESVYEATLDTTMAVMAESAFGIEFHLQNYTRSGDGVWRVYVFRGAVTDSVYAVVENPEQTFQDDKLTDRANPNHIVNGWLNQSCSLRGQTITIRLSEGTFGGRPCSEFDFYDDIDVHSVRYVNTRTNETDRARGTYSILVREADYNESAFYSIADRTDTNQPFHQSAIYAFNYTYVYRTDTTTFVAPNRTVRPEHGDPGGILWEHPRIEQFDVTYVTPDDTRNNTYRVDWRVTHPNAELDEVHVEMVDKTVKRTEESLKDKLVADFDDCDLLAGVTCELTDYLNKTEISQPVNTDTVVAEKTVPVSGPHEGGTTYLVHNSSFDESNLTGTVANNDSKYRVQISVSDSSGRATTAGKHCEIDPTFCEEADA